MEDKEWRLCNLLYDIW